jgi:hypothetical protein
VLTISAMLRLPIAGALLQSRSAPYAIAPITRHPQPRLSIADVVANGAGSVLTGVLTGAAAGPAVSAAAAAAKGWEARADTSQLSVPVAFACFWSVATLCLAALTFQLGSTAIGSAPSALIFRLPLLVFLVGIVAALVPMVALLSGTFLSPAIPFRDQEEADEYQEMQDSYRSDAWKPPKLWPDRRSYV